MTVIVKNPNKFEGTHYAAGQYTLATDLESRMVTAGAASWLTKPATIDNNLHVRRDSQGNVLALLNADLSDVNIGASLPIVQSTGNGTVTFQG